MKQIVGCKIFLLNLVVLSLCHCHVAAQSPVKVLVNFNNGNGPAASPWNNLDGSAASTSLSSLTDDAGQATTISITLLTGWAGVNSSGIDTGNDSGVYPDNVLKNYLRVYNDTETIKFSGLDPAKTYGFRLHSGRASDLNPYTEFEINSNTVVADARYNSTTLVELLDVVPDAQGEVLLYVSNTNGSQGYLNGMEIEWMAGSVPGAPTGLTVSGPTTNALDLGWTDNSPDETGFEIERSASPGTGYGLIHTTLANTTQYTDTGLQENTAYYYRIRAVNATGPSAYTQEASGTTATGTVTTSSSKVLINFTNGYSPAAGPWNNVDDGLSGTTVSGLTDSTGQATPITITLQTGWDGVVNSGVTTGDDSGVYPDDVLKKYYKIYNDTETIKFSGLDPGKTYTFRFHSGRASDLNPYTEFEINGNTVMADSRYNSTTLVELPDIMPGAQGEVLLYARNTNGSSQGYLNGMEIGWEADSSAATAPVAPDNLTATAVNASTIELSWTDNSDNETGFQVERSLTSGTGYVVMDTVQADSVHFTDNGLMASTTYYYRLRAISPSGVSTYTSEVSATTTTGGPGSWLEVTSDGTGGRGFAMFYDNQKSPSVQQDVKATGNTDLEFYLKTVSGSPDWDNLEVRLTVGHELKALYAGDYQVTPITAGWTKVSIPLDDFGHGPTSWQTGGVSDFQLKAVSGFGTVAFGLDEIRFTGGTTPFVWYGDAYTTSGEAASISDLPEFKISGRPATGGYIEPVVPMAPDNLTATVINSNTVDLAWSDNSDNETGFRVERSLTPGTGYVVIDTVAADTASFTDSGLISGTTYYYRIIALGEQSNSQYTSEANATTNNPDPADASWLQIKITDYEETFELYYNSNDEKFQVLNGGNTHLEFYYKFLDRGYGDCFCPPEIGLTVADQTIYLAIQYDLDIYIDYKGALWNKITIPIEDFGFTMAQWVMGMSNFSIKGYSELGIDEIKFVGGTNEFIWYGDNHEESGEGASPEAYILERHETGGFIPPTLPAPTNLTADILSPSEISLNWTDNSGNEDGFQIEQIFYDPYWTFRSYTTDANIINSENIIGLKSDKEYYFRVRAISSDGHASAFSNVLTVKTSDQYPEGLVPDAIELNALIDFYNSTGGPNWYTGTNYYEQWGNPWPDLENLPPGTDHHVFDGWGGVDVFNGDVVSLLYDTRNLSGTLPESLGDLAALNYVELQNNNIQGAFPESIGELINLGHIDAGNNNFSGELPTSLGGMISLYELNLRNNNFSGALPESVSNLINLHILNLDNNNFSGTLPEEMGNLAELKTLYIADNNFYGEIPASMFELENLEYVEAFGNNFSGTFPLKWISYDLDYVSFYGNSLTSLPNFGYPPETYGELDFTGNYLSFQDIEQNLIGPDEYSNYLIYFGYGAQRSPTEIKELYITVSNLRIENDKGGGAHTHYQWQKNDGSGWADIPGAITENLNFSDIADISVGDVYKCEMTNDWVSGQTLYSSVFKVTGLDDPLPTAFAVTPLYNGTITSMKWASAQVEEVEDGPFDGIYLFGYDDKYQLKKAIFGHENAGLVVTNTNNYRLDNLQYDANGNIQSLKRYDGQGSVLHHFDYKYNEEGAVMNNQLERIEGHATYHYNKTGQLTEELKEDGQSKYVDYDVTGKVTAVYSGPAKTENDLKVSYTYDDRGFRLSSTNHETKVTTWYIRDASGNVMSIYEQKEESPEKLLQTDIPIYGSGRVGVYYPQQDGTTDYELTDHLGNVRAVVKRRRTTYTATMEDNEAEDYTNPRVEEMNYFENLFDTEYANDQGWYNHTGPGVVDNPKYSAFLNGTDNIIGPAITLRVEAGDRVAAMEAYGKFEIQENYNQLVLADVASALAGTYINLNGKEVLSELEDIFAGALTGFTADSDDGPEAYINYILFDEDFNVIDQDRNRIPEEAGYATGEQDLGSFEKLYFDMPELEITEPGYIYVYVSNESPGSMVWFDDVSVTLAEKVVSQATDYYPGGSVARRADTPNAYFEASTATEEGSKSFGQYYKYGYQGEFAEEDGETGYNSFEARMYDAVIGRWTTVDPERQYASPYVGFGNNPVNGIDADGKKYYPVNAVLNFYGVGSRESIVFAPTNIFEKGLAAVKTFFGIVDPTSPVELTIALETFEYSEAFQHSTMTNNFEYKLQHANLDYDNLIQYRETLSRVEALITDKMSVLEVRISELRESNANCNCNFNSEEIIDLTNQVWDLEYQLTPIEQDQKLIDTTIQERFSLQKAGSN